MIKRTIKYDDVDGNEREDLFQFSINELEAVELELLLPGGIEATLHRLQETTDAPEAWSLLKEIVLKAYGKKSPDGVAFWKKDENGVPYARDFEGSNALGALLFDFIKDPEMAGVFLQDMLPEKMVKAAQEAASSSDPDEKKAETPSTPELKAAPAVVVDEPKQVSDEELLKMNANDMTREQLVRAMQLRNAPTTD